MKKKKQLIKKEKPEVKKVEEKATPQTVSPLPKKVKDTPQLVRGMRDVLPPEHRYFDFVMGGALSFAKKCGYGPIDIPILEDTSLYVRGTGKYTDIVEKEMFSFVDQGEDALTLRPEFTPGIMRAYINHGMLNLPQPVKLFSYGPVFRHERPQAGRQRQFHQFNFDILGDGHPVLDAELIFLAHKFFEDLGIKITVQVNSIGCPSCREKYKEELVNYYRSHRSKLCENCKKRLVKNPLRILDCKETGCAVLRESAPQMVDFLDDACRDHFTRVLEYLDETDVAYMLNPHLVRGLDYYTKTVFEVWPEEASGAQEALAGGGRYDGLAEVLGGRPTPACGFAGGVERIISRMKSLNLEPKGDTGTEIFLAELGEAARKKALILFYDLLKDGFSVQSAFSKDSLKTQLELANKEAVKLTLILGQKEILDGTIIVRDMDSGAQEIVDFGKLITILKRKLGTEVAAA